MRDRPPLIASLARLYWYAAFLPITLLVFLTLRDFWVNGTSEEVIERPIWLSPETYMFILMGSSIYAGILARRDAQYGNYKIDHQISATEPQTSPQLFNEHLKLTANFLNSIGAAAFLGFAITPLIDPTKSATITISSFMTGFFTGLYWHAMGQMVLRGWREI